MQTQRSIADQHAHQSGAMTDRVCGPVGGEIGTHAGVCRREYDMPDGSILDVLVDSDGAVLSRVITRDQSNPYYGDETMTKTIQPIDDGRVERSHITTCDGCGVRGVFCDTDAGIVDQDGREIFVEMGDLEPLLAGKADGSHTDGLYCEDCVADLTDRTKAQRLGDSIGRAIARDTLADDLPRRWTGIEAQDGDVLQHAGIDPGTIEWHQAEQRAEQAYHAYLADQS